MEKDLSNELNNLKAENEQLREIIDFNINKVETRGRKQKFDEPLSKWIGCAVTPSQKEKFDKILKEAGVDKSTFMRNALGLVGE